MSSEAMIVRFIFSLGVVQFSSAPRRWVAINRACGSTVSDYKLVMKPV
jgi:hypothetical protein